MSRRKKILILFFTFVFLLGIFFCVFFYNKAQTFYESRSIEITDNSSVDYRVYLKENDYFTEKYIPKDSVYITSLIDYVDVNFNYDLDFNDDISGNYTYYVKGVITANVQNTDNKYWSKEYILSDPVTVEFSEKDNLNIIKNVRIDYQKYNTLLTEFKKEYSLSFDGSFKLYLYVTTNIDNDYDDKTLVDESSLSLSIPLTKATIEVPINISNSRTNNTFEFDSVCTDVKRYKTDIIICVSSLLASIMFLVYIIVLFAKSNSNLKESEKEIKKIIKTYNGIIVNVKNIPSFKNKEINQVDDFNELIDAHSEVRMPINFYEDMDVAYFILFNHSMAWIYAINKRG